MDLWAFTLWQDDKIRIYLQKHYWEIPRFRWARFMKVETKSNMDRSEQFNMFDKYVWQDVIYIHTRCWWVDWDEYSNYNACWGKEFEENNKELFLEWIDDEFDPTYRDHYFKAVIDDKYKEILDMFNSEKNE